MTQHYRQRQTDANNNDVHRILFNPCTRHFIELHVNVAYSLAADEYNCQPYLEYTAESLTFFSDCVQFLLRVRDALYSAKRGVAIACRPSVTLVDCDHIGWKYWKLTARTISPTSSLFVAQGPSTSRGTRGNLGRLEVGWEIVACWRPGAQKRQYL